jgi:hypothetical protein
MSEKLGSRVWPEGYNDKLLRHIISELRKYEFSDSDAEEESFIDKGEHSDADDPPQLTKIENMVAPPYDGGWGQYFRLAKKKNLTKKHHEKKNFSSCFTTHCMKQ